jgi:hypothetical protein
LAPNPSIGSINIVLKEGQSSAFPATFTLHDMLGRQVVSVKMQYGIEEIDVLSIAVGLYVWNLSNNGQIYGQGKLVVER